MINHILIISVDIYIIFVHLICNNTFENLFFLHKEKTPYNNNKMIVKIIKKIQRVLKKLMRGTDSIILKIK